MGARLQYAKVIDRVLFIDQGGRIHPGLQSKVLLQDEPGEAAAFLVMRGWGDDHGTFTEQWRLEGKGGGVLYESVPRELHLATKAHVERLEDEVDGLRFEYAADDYSVVFLLDEQEVARTNFRVEPDGRGPIEA
ncbi:MAG: hypothetical protein M3516_09040 [Actinomycetota bacterium]|nr:hypothetical protein [Actinomycetota bacterium]